LGGPGKPGQGPARGIAKEDISMLSDTFLSSFIMNPEAKRRGHVLSSTNKYTIIFHERN
jgi:hypothetical protein